MTPTDALIEKMARAMFDRTDDLPDSAAGHPWTWPGLDDETRSYWRDLARAAYEAEHEETKG